MTSWACCTSRTVSTSGTCKVITYVNHHKKSQSAKNIKVDFFAFLTRSSVVVHILMLCNERIFWWNFDYPAIWLEVNLEFTTFLKFWRNRDTASSELCWNYQQRRKLVSLHRVISWGNNVLTSIQTTFAFHLFCYICMVFPSVKVFPTCFRHLKQDLNSNWNSYPLVEETRPSIRHQPRVVFSRPYVDIFSKNMVSRDCACANKIRKQQYLWTWCQSVVPNDAPRDFGPEVAFGAKLQIPVARQGGREMSAPRPWVTEPFRPLSSINSW